MPQPRGVKEGQPKPAEDPRVEAQRPCQPLELTASCSGLSWISPRHPGPLNPPSAAWLGCHSCCHTARPCLHPQPGAVGIYVSPKLGCWEPIRAGEGSQKGHRMVPVSQSCARQDHQPAMPPAQLHHSRGTGRSCAAQPSSAGPHLGCASRETPKHSRGALLWSPHKTLPRGAQEGPPQSAHRGAEPP